MIEPATIDDRTLAARYLETRSERAFTELYARHAPVMFRCALRQTGSREEAENAVQEAWLRAARTLAGFEWRSQLRSWLVGITLNCCREGVRQRLRVVNADVEPEWIEDAGGASTGPHASSAPGPDLEIDLRRAVDRLPRGAREILILHDVEGLTHEEIAAALEIAAGTAKSQLSRARSLLRRALNPQESRT